VPELERPTNLFGYVSTDDQRFIKPVCFIPARKGSKRLKNKNKLLLNGKPLVLHAVDVAIESGIFGRIMVSSDDVEILEMAYRRKVYPHKRPAKLAGDNLEIKDICSFLLQTIRTTLTAEFAVLSPASPFRTAEDIKNCYKLLTESGANTVMSVVKCPHPPQWALKKGTKYVKPYL